MEIHLPQEVEDIINRHIKSGRYESATQAICQAIFLLDELAEWEDENFPTEYLRQMIQEALDNEGPSVSGKEFFAQWREEIEAQNREAKQPRK